MRLFKFFCGKHSDEERQVSARKHPPGPGPGRSRTIRLRCAQFIYYPTTPVRVILPVKKTCRCCVETQRFPFESIFKFFFKLDTNGYSLQAKFAKTELDAVSFARWRRPCGVLFPNRRGY